jgi:hypothetical protein
MSRKMKALLLLALTTALFLMPQMVALAGPTPCTVPGC